MKITRISPRHADSYRARKDFLPVAGYWQTLAVYFGEIGAIVALTGKRRRRIKVPITIIERIIVDVPR